ncbi:MAG: hypothetical protein Q9225_005556 [Loekoesia sp. 1 TL-2023]
MGEVEFPASSRVLYFKTLFGVMRLSTQLLSLVALTSTCISISLPPLLPRNPTPSSLPDNASPPSTTYFVPNTHIKLKLTAYPDRPPSMSRAAIINLIETGKAALDILAARAGGDTADLDVPAIRWAMSGLAIHVSDATRRRPETGGGPFRFDELKAAYDGVREAVDMIGNVECWFEIWRVYSSTIRWRVKRLGGGTLTVDLGDGRGGNGTVGLA